MCRIVSYYINKYEKISRIVKQQLVDRFNLLKFGWIYEWKYQSRKLELVELYLKMYENTYDPLEAYRCAIKILSVMSKQSILD